MHSKKFNRSSSSSYSTNTPTASNLPPRGLRVQAAADYAGVTCWCIRSWIWEGVLRARSGGKFLIILKDDLDLLLESLPLVEANNAAWLKARREKSANEAEAEQVVTR
jgi:hypothetical protein